LEEAVFDAPRRIESEEDSLRGENVYKSGLGSDPYLESGRGDGVYGDSGSDVYSSGGDAYSVSEGAYSTNIDGGVRDKEADEIAKRDLERRGGSKLESENLRGGYGFGGGSKKDSDRKYDVAA